MPPRYAYWTILVDNQPTAFRAGAQEDLMPTFKRLKEKHPSAVMMWFQNGKLWNSRVDAQEAMRARGEMGRRGDVRQGGQRDRERRPIDRGVGPEWKPKASRPRQSEAPASGKIDWKPKGSFAPQRSEKLEWRSKSGASPERRPEWKPKGRPSGRPKHPSDKLEWRPKSGSAPARTSAVTSEKRKWIPKEEYKKSKGIEAPRDSKWRPGGDHKDPRQKYKDAKKAKWSRFKKAIRTRWEEKDTKRRRGDKS